MPTAPFGSKWARLVADMNCPICRLINPEGAQRCDCGYNFTLRAMPEARLENGRSDARGRYVTALLAASLALATAALVFFLAVPAYSGERSELRNSSPGSERTPGSNAGTNLRRFALPSRTMLEVNGPRALIPLMIPIVLAAAPLLARYHGVRIAAAALLLIFCFIGAASVGLFYLPAALAMIAASCISDAVPLQS